ncbi:MAG: hypothetical protein MJ252_01275 [archaeon]|nr:hypothetical protein [archaeon]
MSNLTKQQLTQNIVSNLKQKINEFKSKKQQEKAERKDILNFEINKDLVNQFRKNKGEPINVEVNKPTTPNNNILMNDEFTLQKKPKENKLKDLLAKETNIQNKPNLNLSGSNLEIDNTQGKRKLKLDNINKMIFNDNTPIASKDSGKLILDNFNIGGNSGITPNIGVKQNTSFLNISQDEGKNINPVLNSKKEEIMGLFGKNKEKNTSYLGAQNIPSPKYQKISNFQKKVMGLNTNPNSAPRSSSTQVPRPLSGGYNYSQNNPKSKEKSKKFLFQLDEDKISSQLNKPKSNYLQNKKDGFDFALSQKSSYGNTKKIPFRNTGNNDLDSFADFSLKTNFDKKLETRGFMDFELAGKKMNEFKLGDHKNDFNFNFKSRQSSKGNMSSTVSDKFNLGEIRALNNKIKYLGKDDISHLDKSIIDELISLGNSIKRCFGS